MIQLVIEGVFIDLYENDPPKLTFSIEDIFDTQATSTYSQNFRVPATNNNWQYFQNAFEVDGYDFDITQRKEAQILVNGAEFSVGFVRLQKIYKSESKNKIDYELLFLGETKSLGTLLGNKTLSQLDFSEFTTDLTYAKIVDSWDAYPEGGLNDGLFSGSVIFPLVDFGNTYDGDTLQVTRMGVGTTNYFTDSSYPIEINRFKPMVRAKVVWDKIFAGTNYTYESTFLSSSLFRKLYISAWGNEAVNTIDIDGSANIVEVNGLSTPFILLENYPAGYRINYDTEISDPSNNFNISLDEYVVPTNGSYNIAVAGGVNIKRYPSTLLPAWEIVISLKKISGGITTTLDSITVNQSNSTEITENYLYQKYYSLIYNGSFTAGDKIYSDITYGGSTAVALDLTQPKSGRTFQVLNAPGDWTLSPYLNSKYKQVDFIKDILTKFRLVLARDKTNPYKFIIEPWESYIGTGDIYDWSSKLDLSKDVQIEPLFNTQTLRVVFNDKEDKDVYNELNVNQFNESFGTLEVNANNDLITGERTIQTTLSPTPISEINNATSGVASTFIIPHIYTIDGNGSSPKFKPIVPNTRLLFYNGLRFANDTYYIEDEGTTVHSHTYYSMVSPYDSYPLTSATLDLNWQREIGYSRFLPTNPLIGYSVYDSYWSSYINFLYNKYSRRVVANFILSAEDLENFSFDDVIFVKGVYYYVEKLESVPLGEKTSVKTTLIKLNDYVVPQGGFIPLGEYWEDITDNWDSITTTNWEDI